MNKKHGSMTIDELRLNQFSNQQKNINPFIIILSKFCNVSNQQKNIDPLIILHSKFDND